MKTDDMKWHGSRRTCILPANRSVCVARCRQLSAKSTACVWLALFAWVFGVSIAMAQAVFATVVPTVLTVEDLYSERQQDVVYGRKDGMALTMDVFVPRAKTNGAGVVMIVSGGWASSHSAINIKFAEHYLRRGYTVFAVVHSSQPRYFIPEIIPDIHRAVRFIRHNAPRWQVDPMRLGATGASAGGHLSLILGTQGADGPADAKDPVDRETSKVQAVACFFPPTDFNNYVKPDKNALDESVLKNFRKSIGPIPESEIERDELGRKISPIYSVTSSSAPTLIIHGNKDQHVLVHQATRFVDTAIKAGAVAKLIVKEGKPHGWPEMSEDVEVFADWFDLHL